MMYHRGKVSGKAQAFLVLFLFLASVVFAQDRNPDVDDWDDFRTTLYMRGDQQFIISLGTIFPLVFLNNGSVRDMNFRRPVGGGGSLAYQYFLTPNFFWGGEIGVQFISSINGDSLFIIPLGLRGGYMFNIWKLEIPVTLTLGGSWQRFLSEGYFGLYSKLGASAYYRFTNSWSFGLTTHLFWFPQWTKDSRKNMDGFIIDLNLSARYNF